MLLKIILAAGFIWLGKFAFEEFDRNQSEEQVKRLITQVNARLPAYHDTLLVEHLEYPEHKHVRYTGALSGQRLLTDSLQSDLRRRLLRVYCERDEFRKLGFKVDYAYRMSLTGRKPHEKPREEVVTVQFRPDQC